MLVNVKERRNLLKEIVSKDGFSGLPTQEELAKQFEVSQQQISLDMKAILPDLGTMSSEHAMLEYRSVCRSIIRKFESLEKEAKQPETKMRILDSLRKTIASEIELRMKLGMIKSENQNLLSPNESIEITFKSDSKEKPELVSEQ